MSSCAVQGWKNREKVVAYYESPPPIYERIRGMGPGLVSKVLIYMLDSRVCMAGLVLEPARARAPPEKFPRSEAEGIAYRLSLRFPRCLGHGRSIGGVWGLEPRTDMIVMYEPHSRSTLETTRSWGLKVS